MKKNYSENKKNNVDNSSDLSRRRFLGEIGGITATTIAIGTGLTAGLEIPASAETSDNSFGGLTGAARAEKAYESRVQAALQQKTAPLPDHPTNRDEDFFANKIGNYSKGLPHNQLGEVDLGAWETFMQAIKSGSPDDFEKITMGGTEKLTSPQAGLAYDMEGPDPMHLAQRPAPVFSSAEEAAEIAENYWMALTRDVNFLDYDSNALTNAAAQDLSRFSDFRGPKFNRAGITRNTSSAAATYRNQNTAPILGQNAIRAEVEQLQRARRDLQSAQQVTTGTLFRGNTPGDLVGPYLSQFLWMDVPFGTQTISQKMRTVIPEVDYLTNYGDWLSAQNGIVRTSYAFDPTPRYIRNGRDLAEWVHIDVLFQAYFNAMIILLGMGAPFDEGNPYNNSRTQKGFATFGGPHINAMMCNVAAKAIKAVWFQKWYVHRRLRPEAFAGAVHNTLTRAANYPVHSEIFDSAAVQVVNRKTGSNLLPMAFPEGCPTHPSYGAGHATVAGACVTVLKAWFDESYVIPNPVVPSADGLSLVPYRGTENLTVGGELNKVAANVAFGRNIAGVHWRSDAWESMKLGEAVAIGVLSDYKGCYNERFEGFTLTKFDGTRVGVG